MNQNKFNNALGGMFGNNDKKYKYTFCSDKDWEPERVEGYIRQFIFDKKLGGKIKLKQYKQEIYQSNNYYYCLELICSEIIFQKFKSWLIESDINYDFEKTINE